MKRAALALLWLAAAVPGLLQLRLLAIAIAGRVAYPYDLEWMEGGMLHHALRVQQGQGIYVQPSIDFIPYLYTPLYPGVLALLGGLFGLSYTTGRVISVLSLVGIAAVAASSLCGRRCQLARRGEAWAGLALALGVFAAAYPYCEGWYDLVRADTLFLMLVTTGIAGLARWAVVGTGWRGHARVAAGAVILVLAFFTKQTGFVYVGFGGLVVLVLSWRRAPIYTVVAGALALGLVAIFNATTDGWFWTYVSKIHRAHNFSWHRFRDSFGLILWHFPLVTVTIGAGLGVVLVTAIRVGPRALPRQTQPLLLWSATLAVSTVVGAIGYGTEWAVYNAFMPAFLHGGLAAGATLAAVAACARVLVPRHAGRAGVIAAALFALPLGVQLVRASWDPQRFIPKPSDAAAGDALIAQLHAIDGDIWTPSHPWYAVLAGHVPHVHRMGIKDVTRGQQRDLGGLEAAIRAHQFSAILFDNVDLPTDWQGELDHLRGVITSAYRPAFELPKTERPHVINGGHVVPTQLWVPALPAAAPPGARVVFDFESPTWAGWTQSGGAWGAGPVTASSGAPVFGATGQRFASSAATGDAGVGRVTSPEFALAGARLTLALGGGTDATTLRVELWVDGGIAATATVPPPGGDTLQRVTIPIAALRGKTGKLVLVDESPAGHLEVDDVWLWDP